MKKQTLSCAIFLLLSLLPVGCKISEKTQDINGYLQAKWGMSKQEIRQLIKLPLTDETGNVLMFSDVIDENNVTRMYMFDKKDRLLGVMIMFELPNQDETLFRNTFSETYSNIALKYGDADEYKEEDLNKKGLSSTWKFKSSRIMLQMFIKKPFNQLALAVLYMNEDYAEEYIKSKPTDKY